MDDWAANQTAWLLISRQSSETSDTYISCPVRFTAALMLETNDIPRPAQSPFAFEAQQVAVQVFYNKRSRQNVIIHSAFCGANNQRESSHFRLIFLHGWN